MTHTETIERMGALLAAETTPVDAATIATLQELIDTLGSFRGTTGGGIKAFEQALSEFQQRQREGNAEAASLAFAFVLETWANLLPCLEAMAAEADI